MSSEDINRIGHIVSRVCDHQNIAVLTVLITLLVKKIMAPEQDIRFHQASMKGGFSGRGLDERKITPFLRENNFPYMAAGSGWLTRSLEQAFPYDLNYPGRITPTSVKNDFLNLIHKFEHQPEFAQECLNEIFLRLVAYREKSENIALSRPKNKSINVIVSLIESLWNKSYSGASRIPVIAVFAAYQCLIFEVNRYRDHKLLPLLAHNAADRKTGRIADIDLQKDSKTIESVEIKHGIKINPELVLAAIEKVKRTTVKRYYMLSTHENLNRIEQITRLTTEAKMNHGCEIIVNGVAATFKYYLRLIANTDDFIDNFVALLEKDNDVGYETKMAWDSVVNQQLE